jgi:hypothetical protein
MPLTARQAARLVGYGSQHWQIDHSQKLHYSTVPADLKTQVHCGPCVLRTFNLKFHGYPSCESSEPKGGRMYWWTKAATASARVTESTIVGKGAGVIRIGSTLRENPNPNTAGPDFLLTQSQMSQQQLRNTLFLGVQWVQWIRVAFIAQKISFETRDVGLRVERHPLAMAPPTRLATKFTEL